MTISEKIKALRLLMKSKGIDAWIIPGTDPHQSEYLPEHWNEREWISGFTGSFGQVVITQTKAGLWTDSRYFLQAQAQLTNTEIKLYKLRIEGEPSINDFIVDELSENTVLGFNPLLFSIDAVDEFNNLLAPRNIKINTQEDLIAEIWSDRVPISDAPCVLLKEQYAGRSAKNKIDILRSTIIKKNSSLIVSALDEIAWLFNIRGKDIAYNPVNVAWAVVSNKLAILFINKQKITTNIEEKLKSQGISVRDYHQIIPYLSTLPVAHDVYLDTAKVNQKLFQSIPSHCNITKKTSPVALSKALKNEVEIKGFQNAMVKDGISLVKFLVYLENTLSKNKNITEFQVGEKLAKLRSLQPLFFGESFNTIAGYNGNGAIVHYAPSSDSSATLKANGTLLFDSGAQYYDGTTDITRTVALGEVSQEVIHDYTLVLKGFIALSRAIFPKGTCGIQLDILARNAMWQEKIDYGHGTGHGVGHFLNVHEGPHAIRKEGNMIPLQTGMVVTIEPGIYKTDRHGIRTENMVTVVDAGTTEFGTFLKFETLTLCPIDKHLIDRDFLYQSEVDWLNTYHQAVYTKLSPHLSLEENVWLKNKTSPLNA